MKHIIAAFLLIGVFPLLAQEDITRDDLPNIGDGGIYRSPVPQNLQKSPDEMSGEDKNWDYKNIGKHEQTYEIEWFDIEDAPDLHKEHFEDAELYEYNANSKEYRYYFQTDSSLSLIGRHVQGQFIDFDEAAIDYIFPLSFNEEVMFEFKINESNLGRNTLKFDGTGSLEIPSGTYNDVFRIKYTYTVIDSEFDDTSSTIQFKFFERGGNHPVFIMTELKDQNNNYAFEYKVSGFTGIDQQLSENTQVFPNPASEFLQIKLPDVTALDIQLIDQNGKLIRTQKFEESINISDLQSGMYYIKINTITDKKIVRKFIKK